MKTKKPEHIAQTDWDAVDSPPLDSSLLAAMKPVKTVHPNIPPRVCGPQKGGRKTFVSVRLDEAVVSAFRDAGQDWQSRINDVLHDWLKEHKLA